MRPSSLLAVVVSAALGIGLGVAGGLMVDRDDAPFTDPLALGIPFQNQACTGKVLFTIGRGGAGQLGAALTQNSDVEASYLATAKSCPTTWVPNGGSTPPYVAYVGPFGDRPAACNAQFSAGHRGGIVTRLRSDATDTVQCLCYVTLAAPTMKGGMSTEGTDGIWIRQLQNLLIDMGRAPDEEISGSYDATTAAKIRDFQRDNHLSATGVVDAATWERLKQQGCKLYKS